MSVEVEQIKERIGVVEFIGEYLTLEKAGNNYKGLCPFHNEKTPSFMVNQERNFWYCFGCQKGGDIFTFVQEIEGINFPEALQRLAEKAGVELPKFDPKYKQERSAKQKLFEILKLSAQFYQHQLKHNAEGKKAGEYLRGRKIDDQQIAQFGLGYAPGGWQNLLNFLVKKGYSAGEIFKTGALVQKDASFGNSGDYYDRFRDRIMFPIIDVAGNVLGFSARVAPGGDETTAKYINTPQTEIYDKSSVLYGLFQSKIAIRSADFAVVVEGNVDVIASHCAGVKNVVAVSGTALTQQHLNLIKRYTRNVKLCFDMDEAGQKAAQKSIRTCLLSGLEVEVILLPSGSKDVGDLVQKDPKLWQKAIEKAIPVMDYYFKSVLSKYDAETVKDKKNIAKELLNIIKDVADPIEQSYWLKKLARLIQIDEEVLTAILEKSIVKKDREQYRQAEDRGDSSKKQFKKPKRVVLEELILGLFYLYKKDLESFSSELDPNLLDENFAKIWQNILTEAGSGYREVLDQYALKIQYRSDEKKGFVENEIDPLKEWKVVLRELENETKKERAKKIMKDIGKAQETGDEEAVDLLMGELDKLQRV